jgi:sarcosine oxidase/L-pipecolate oxidase
MGFMLMPAVGRMVADALEGVMEPRMKHGFRWRPETATHRDWRDTQDRYGGDGTVMDLQKVTEWTNVGAGA